MRILLASLLVLASCRILPPLPSMNLEGSDERMFNKLSTVDWSKVSLGVSFDGATVQATLGDGIVDRNAWDVLTPGDYARRFPEESSGIRRLFKFYVMETSALRGLSVFVHEAVHGFNWIDIFDSEYNEFLSIAGELRLAEAMASTDPDKALVVISDALTLGRPRDDGYSQQVHMRARLMLCALLPSMTPTQIYRWARDTTKEDFADSIHEAFGCDPRDVKREGATALCRQLWGDDRYIDALLEMRDEPHPRTRRDRFESLLSALSLDSPFYDNVEYQILSCNLALGRHEEVLMQAEGLWEKVRIGHLASAVALESYEAACALHSAQARDLWHNRAVSIPQWSQQSWQGELTRAESRCRHGLMSLEAAMDLAGQIRSSDFAKEFPLLVEESDAFISRVLVQELQTQRARRVGEATLERALAEALRLGDKRLITMARSRLGDRAFERGDLEEAFEAYRESSGIGGRRLESQFWLEFLP